MKHNEDIDFFRAILISLVILVHIVNFGNIYPALKDSILSFIMPAFLLITGYLVNINKSIKGFLRYLWQIWLPYMIFVLGYAVLSLYLPVRDGVEVLSARTILNILFIKSIGPYWFFRVMMVCGILYYITFQFTPIKWRTTTKYSLFASALLLISLWTPLLSIRAAVYYFIGVGIRIYIIDLSKAYRKSIWPIIPFGIMITEKSFHDWGAISILICVISFLCFSSFLFSLFQGHARKVVTYIGRNTFPIYVFHPMFTMMAKFVLPMLVFDSTGILHAVLTIFIGIIGSIYIAKFLDWSHFSYLLGREKMLR